MRRQESGTNPKDGWVFGQFPSSPRKREVARTDGLSVGKVELRSDWRFRLIAVRRSRPLDDRFRPKLTVAHLSASHQSKFADHFHRLHGLSSIVARRLSGLCKQLSGRGPSGCTMKFGMVRSRSGAGTRRPDVRTGCAWAACILGGWVGCQGHCCQRSPDSSSPPAPIGPTSNWNPRHSPLVRRRRGCFREKTQKLLDVLRDQLHEQDPARS